MISTSQNVYRNYNGRADDILPPMNLRHGLMPSWLKVKSSVVHSAVVVVCATTSQPQLAMTKIITASRAENIILEWGGK
ncbi:hypothetical protein K439DRAFT_1643456 [Ramaria rubella]|nr:hypothetical protein K439DRAFT_1643456 [Ramaria rubella]